MQQPKFQNPNVLVELNFLDRALAISRSSCPVDGCKKPIVSHSLRVDGAAAKATFLCARGHPTTWASCEQLGRQALMLNRLVPCAAIMAGLKILPMKRFLGLLQVDSQGSSYMKVSSVDLLARLTNQLYLEEIKRVREEMLEYESFDLGTILDVTKFNF